MNDNSSYSNFWIIEPNDYLSYSYVYSDLQLFYKRANPPF